MNDAAGGSTLKPARAVATTRAPGAIGPYTQGQVVRAGDLEWLYTAGQVGLDPAAGELVKGGAAEQLAKNSKASNELATKTVLLVATSRPKTGKGLAHVK